MRALGAGDGKPLASGELRRRVGLKLRGSLSAIALTTFVRPEDRTRALSAGHQIHVSKAVEASEPPATVAIVAGKVGTPST